MGGNKGKAGTKWKLQYARADPPVPIAKFPGSGVVAPSDVAVCSYAADKAGKMGQRMLAGSVRGVRFEGYTHGSQRSTSRLQKYLVGVENPKTGVITLHDAELFALQPVLPSRVRKRSAFDLANEGDNEDDEEVDGDNKAVRARVNAAKTRLTQEFGAKKKKQQVQSLIINSVGADNLASKGMEKALQRMVDAKATVMTIPTNEPTETDHGILPPFVMSATTPAECYPLELLIPAATQTALAPLKKTLVKATMDDIEGWRASKEYPQYVLNYLDKLIASGAKESQKKKVGALLAYATLLLKFRNDFNLKSFNSKNSEEKYGYIPKVIQRRFLQLFTEELADPKGKMRPQRTNKSRDKHDLHIMVVALHLSSFIAFDPEVLLPDMQPTMTLKKAKNMLKMVGCKVNGNDATLQAPLVFPKPKRAAAPKR